MNIDLLPVIKSRLKLVETIVFVVLGLLYLYVSYNSYGYDDEYFNIRQIREHNLSDLINTIQQTDIHPPLSYIINKLLFSVLNDWTFVRMASSVFFLAALWLVCRKAKNHGVAILFLLFLGLNPSVLLWTTSIRWYAYVLPLLMLLHLIPPYESKWYWWRFFILSWLICMLGYIGFLMIPVYFIYYWLQDGNRFMRKCRRILLPGLLFVSGYTYQFYIFLTIHNRTELSGNQQVFDLFVSIQSYIASVFSNQGLFPLSFFGLLSVAGMFLICLHALINIRTYLTGNKFFFLFVGLSVIAIVTGVAGKIRNLFLLEPSKVSFITTNPPVTRGKWLWMIGLLFVFAANLRGVYNVVKHQQTTKNGWNIKMPETMAKLDSMERKKETIYFTHHPSFSYHLTVAGKQVVSFYNGLYFDSSLIKTTVQKLDTTMSYDIVFLVNYRGRSISEQYFQSMMDVITKMKESAVKTEEIFLHEDPDFTAKKRFYKDYPQYTTSIIQLQDVRVNTALLSVWEKNQ